MSALSFFEKLVGLQKQRADTAIGNYRELVAAIARDDEPDPVEVERLLADVDKSVDELRQDVERCQHRMKLKAAVAAMPQLEAERDKLEEEIAAADKILEAAEQQHEEATRPLHARRREVLAALSEGSTALGELVYTCEDGDLRLELEEAEAESHRLERECHDLKERARRVEKQAKYERERAEQALLIPDRRRHKEQADEHQKKADALLREARKLEKTRADLDKRRQKIEQKMREA